MSNEQSIPILSRLRPAEGAVRSKRRKGRGPGSGLGKTSGKGQKGQKARHPGNFGKLGFEGGQIPLQRRLPKIGFTNLFRRDYAVVNIADLNRFPAGTEVTVSTLKAAGLVRHNAERVKILSVGTLQHALTVKADAFSRAAIQKIQSAGGQIDLLSATRA